MNSSLGRYYKGPKMAPTPVSDYQYKGLTLDPKRRGSLFGHGAFPTASTSASSHETHNRRDIQATESLTSLRNVLGSSTLGNHHQNTSFNKKGHDISTHAGTHDSPFSSEAEIHPSSGVPLNRSDSTMPTTTLPQRASFSQLAERQGIHDWNNSVFDDRWLLQPEEIWNMEGRRDSATTASPKGQASNGNSSRTDDRTGSYAEGSQRSSTQNAYIERLREAEEKTKEQHGNAPTETRSGNLSESLTTSGGFATGTNNMNQ